MPIEFSKRAPEKDKVKAWYNKDVDIFCLPFKVDHSSNGTAQLIWQYSHKA